MEEDDFTVMNMYSYTKNGIEYITSNRTLAHIKSKQGGSAAVHRIPLWLIEKLNLRYNEGYSPWNYASSSIISVPKSWPVLLVI